MATRALNFTSMKTRKCFRPWSLRQREPAEHEIRVENSHWYQLHRFTHIRSGLYPPPSLPPVGPGTEAVGVVSKVGNGVEHIRVGDRVVYAQSTLGALQFRPCNVPADKAAILPDAISFEQRSFAGLTVFTLLRKTW